MNNVAKTAFISHSTIDDGFVVELKGLILSLGYKTVFNDADHDSIKPDQEFWPQIVRGIKESDTLVVVISAKSVNSNWVTKEVEFARSIGKPVLPILIEDCLIPEVFRDRDVIDFRLGHRNLLDGENKRPMRAYLARLIEILESKHGVLNYLPRVGNVDVYADNDEFGFSVLIEETLDSPKISMPLNEAIDKHRAIVITGDPGVGKSTAIRRMVTVMASNFDVAGGNGTIPILIDLTNWTTETELDEVIRNTFKEIPEITGILEDLNYAVFLDGLNEVLDESITDSIISAVRKAIPCCGPIGLQRLVITCRTMEYLGGDKNLKEKLSLPNITISDLTTTEILSFCGNYLKSSSESLLEIIARQNLWGLASNAYMLCALITIFQHRGVNKFPNNAAELFPALIKALWYRECKRGYGGTLTNAELSEGLSELAFFITMENGFGEFDLESLPESLSLGQAMIDLACRCGLLQGGDGTLRFNHQLTQEYFNAAWLRETKLTVCFRKDGTDYTRMYKNSFRILGGMDVGSIGARLFQIDPQALLAWVDDGVYQAEGYVELVEDLIKLPEASRFYYSGVQFEVLEEVMKLDVNLSTPSLLRYLVQAQGEVDLRAIVIILNAITKLTQVAEGIVLGLLDCNLSYSRHTQNDRYDAVSPTLQVRIWELAAQTIFRLGSNTAVALAIKKVAIWLDNCELAEIHSGFSGIGSESVYERLGNRAFTFLLDGPAKDNLILSQFLRGWLEKQVISEGVAQIQRYEYFGNGGEIEITQSDWARNKIRELAE